MKAVSVFRIPGEIKARGAGIVRDMMHVRGIMVDLIGITEVMVGIEITEIAGIVNHMIGITKVKGGIVRTTRGTVGIIGTKMTEIKGGTETNRRTIENMIEGIEMSHIGVRMNIIGIEIIDTGKEGIGTEILIRKKEKKSEMKVHIVQETQNKMVLCCHH